MDVHLCLFLCIHLIPEPLAQCIRDPRTTSQCLSNISQSLSQCLLNLLKLYPQCLYNLLKSLWNLLKTMSFLLWLGILLWLVRIISQCLYGLAKIVFYLLELKSRKRILQWKRRKSLPRELFSPFISPSPPDITRAPTCPAQISFIYFMSWLILYEILLLK